MIRQYKNKKIERNLKITNILFIISICLSILTVIVYLITRYGTKTAKVYDSEVYFYIMALGTPMAPMLFQDFGRETKRHNDFSNALGKIILVHIEVVLLIFFSIIFGIIGAFESSTYSFGFAFYFGYCLIAHSLSYVASYILIYNCVLIKREWKENPPHFAKKEYEEREQRHNETNYKSLIEKCGIKFFIKYYKQIERLPLRDVSITENYSPSEREERLTAAKKIIDLNLTEFTLNEILKSYGDILDETELAQAKSILSILTELQQSSNCPVQEVKVQLKQQATTAAMPLYRDIWDD